MKELSIEEKSYVAYKELINRLEDVKNAIKKQNYGIAMDILCNPYPEFQITASTELKESEDEKWIPKEIAKYLKEKGGFRSCWIAWLEKQGEQKPADVRTTGYWLVEDTEQKPADKVEPKFHVGDWIIHNKNTELANSLMLVVDKVSDGYLCKYRDGQRSYNIEFIDKEYRLWTIQDAKDGDVLAANDWIFIFKGVNNNNISCYCHYDYDEDMQIFNVDTNYYMTTGSPIYPATKEERALLFQKMKEVGYEWNAEKKELKKIENKNPLLSDFFKAEYERGKADAQKPYWSEEDEKFFKAALWHISNSISNGNSTDIDCDTTDWLKSLRDRVQPKQEWSEEDERMYIL